MSAQTKEYGAGHRAVKRARGKASDYPCEHECGNPAASWAQITDTKGDLPSHYKPLCWPCHHVYDDRWNEDERKRVAESVAKYHSEMSDEERALRGARISAGKLGKKRSPASEEAKANMRAGQAARRNREVTASHRR